MDSVNEHMHLSQDHGNGCVVYLLYVLCISELVHGNWPLQETSVGLLLAVVLI